MSDNSVNSMASIKAWMKQQPRTLGWDAILAYDRVKTNQMLMQEYIGRFDNPSGYLAPITSVVPETSPSEHFYGVIVSTPVLSFENSTIASSDAKLTFDLVGGSHITMSIPTGGTVKEVTQISEFSPLAGEKIWLNIGLEQAPGTVTGERNVQLDLSKVGAAVWRSSLGATEQNRQRVAEYFHDLFAELEPKYQVFVLNTIKNNDSPLANPGNFEIRVQPKKGSSLIGLDAEGVDEEDGQILVFMAMKGRESGSLPAKDGDMAYLIPDEPGYSTTLLFGSDYIYSRLFVEGLKTSDDWLLELPGFEIVQPDGEHVTVVTGVAGQTNMHFAAVHQEFYDAHCGPVNMEPYLKGDESERESTFTMTPNPSLGAAEGLVDGGLTLHWKGESKGVGGLGIEGRSFRVTYHAKWDYICHCAYYIDRQGAYLVQYIDFDKAESRAWMDQVLSWQIEDEYYDDLKRAICKQYEGEIDNGFYLRTSDLVSALNSINMLGLKSLLFGNEDVIRYSATCFTGDLALFGDISPQETSFSVSPISPIVVAGEVHTCVTEPPVTGLVWTITALGGDNAIGTIDSISGKYTAPAAAQITGPMTRVRVTATNALNGYKSSGLISVVKTSLNVNPLVQVATAGLDLKLTLTAGSVKGQPKDIVWDIEDDATGAIITSNLYGTCTYQAGPPVTGKYSWVDTVVASYGNDSSSCAVVVFNGQQNLSITIDADSVRSEKAVESVTLVALNNGGSPIPGVKWALLTGSGSVNENTGVFTVNPQGSYRYAVVTGTLVIPGIITLLGHIILPLPLLTIDRAVELLNG